MGNRKNLQSAFTDMSSDNTELTVVLCCLRDQSLPRVSLPSHPHHQKCRLSDEWRDHSTGLSSNFPLLPILKCTLVIIPTSIVVHKMTSLHFPVLSLTTTLYWPETSSFPWPDSHLALFILCLCLCGLHYQNAILQDLVPESPPRWSLTWPPYGYSFFLLQASLEFLLFCFLWSLP